MKNAMMALLALTLGIAAGTVAAAEIAQEGTFTGTNAFSGTGTTLAVGQDHLQLNYEVLGVSLNDEGKGFGHNVSIRCVGALHAVKGTFDNESGMCGAMDLEGDQYFLMYTASGTLGRTAAGSYEYVGGTGKYEGITGEGEFTRTSLRPVAEGTFQSRGTVKGSWKLP